MHEPNGRRGRPAGVVIKNHVVPGQLSQNMKNIGNTSLHNF